MIIFGAVFSIPAIIFLFWSIIPSIYDAAQMRSWQAASATLYSAELTSHRGKTTTYKANATYQFNVGKYVYKNDRVQISSGSDNVGNFQEKFGSKLERDYNNKSPITIYYNLDNPHDSIIHRNLRWELLFFELIFVAVFGFAGIGILLWGWFGHKTNTAPETLHQPWLSELKWMDNKINSDSKSSVYLSAIFAIFWNLISMPMAILFITDDNQKEGIMVTMIVMLFPIVGLGLVYWVFHNLKEWRTFGRTPLSLKPFPGEIGGDVAGKVLFKHRLSSEHDYSVTLTCVWQYTTGSGDNKRTSEDLIWQKEGTAKLKQVLLKNANSELRFRFKVPEGLEESDTGQSSNRHIWRLTLENKELGLNRSFEIPVYAVASQQSLSRQEYSSLDDVNNASPELINRHKEKIDIKNYLPFQDSSISSLGSFSQETIIHYPIFRKFALNGLFALIGIIFFSIGIYLWNDKDAPLVIAIIFSFLGGLTGLAGLYNLGNSLKVTLDKNTLKIVKKLFGFTISKQAINYSDIQDVTSKESYRTQSGGKNIIHYNILALLHNGKKLKIAEAENATARKIVHNYFQQELKKTSIS